VTAETSAVLAESPYRRLLELLRELRSVAVACSGGLDSGLLLAAAHRELGDQTMALTVVTPYMAVHEVAAAKALTAELGARHRVLELPIPAAIADNPPDRCYRCKSVLFAELKAVAATEGCVWLADGTNRDDLDDYRPGLRALRELGVRSPLLEAGLGKADIRRYAKALDLPVWDKPASACLLTRLPHDVDVDPAGLRRIEAAERALSDLGFGAVRVRCHGDLARIELDRGECARLLDGSMGARAVAALTACGFRYVTLDLQGYRMGSFNVVAATE
jgi:uncharacterized protein